MDINVKDIIYYKSPITLESYGIVVNRAREVFSDNREGDIFYFVDDICNPTKDVEIVYKKDIIAIYKRV